MKRIAIGAVTALSVWFGSALAAEAQTITPNGPTTLTAGASTWNFTAAIYLPTPMGYKMTTSIYKNDVFQTSFTKIVSNPGTQYSSFNQQCDVSFSFGTSDVIKIKTTMLYNRANYYGPDYFPTIVSTRPSSKIEKRASVLALQNVERDRRRE